MFDIICLFVSDMQHTLTSSFIAAASLSKLVLSLDNGVGITPAMGWNPYNVFLYANRPSILTVANAL